MDVNKRRVVIVGGGIAGGLLAKTIQFDADLVLIDTKEYFEITWAELRAKVEPSFGERSVINHSEYLSNGRLVVSSAIGISETEVLTADGRSIPYDYLVIATGHSGPTPKTRDNRFDQFREDNQKIKNSNSILIIGGGPTGVELAGEIVTDFPDKKEIKQGYLAQKHAKVVAKNPKVLISGGKDSRLSSYKPASATALVSLGRKDGVAQLPLATLSGCIPGFIKSRDLFVGKARKEMGLDP